MDVDVQSSLHRRLGGHLPHVRPLPGTSAHGNQETVRPENGDDALQPPAGRLQLLFGSFGK